MTARSLQTDLSSAQFSLHLCVTMFLPPPAPPQTHKRKQMQDHKIIES